LEIGNGIYHRDDGKFRKVLLLHYDNT